MKLYFSGCARDCANVIASNILALLAIADNPWCEEVKVFVAENNSKDDTKSIIGHLAAQDTRIVPIYFADLDKIISVREARIAFCRDRLLYEIQKITTDALYIPIDLDSTIATSLKVDQFRRACQLVCSNKCVGIFPSSYPYYYDIHALRETNWCPRSCWKDFYESNSRGALWSLFAYIIFVSSKQKHYLRLQADQPNLIPVNSAFGGIGIYSLSKVSTAGASYSSTDLEQETLKLCEHVVFNATLRQLFICTEWVITAPPEHIEFRLLPNFMKIWRVIQAALDDIKHVLIDFLKYL